MKITQSRLFLSAAAIGALVLVPAVAQENTMVLNKAQLASIHAQVLRPMPVTLWTVTQDFTGNFQTASKEMEEFSAEFRKQKLQTATAPVPILVLYEDPTGKASFRHGIGVQVTQKLEVKAPFKIEQMTHPSAIRVTHVGSLGLLESVHHGIKTELAAIKPVAQPGMKKEMAVVPRSTTSWPVVIRYLNDPRTVPAAQLRSELIVPITK